MRVRMQDQHGDMVFGQGSANFWINSAQGVQQAIITGLRLWRGQFFYNTAAGMPWTQEVIGFGTQAIYDQAVQSQIKSTEGVTGIDSYSSSLNPKTRHLTINAKGQSLYGPFVISTEIPVAPAGGFGVGGFATRGFGQ